MTPLAHEPKCLTTAASLTTARKITARYQEKKGSLLWSVTPGFGRALRTASSPLDGLAWHLDVFARDDDAGEHQPVGAAGPGRGRLTRDGQWRRSGRAVAPYQ